jgi:peptidoglycan/LPS O-acetylase OafA/YrhL
VGDSIDASNAPTNRENRYAHIDAMRAFAVLLVVFAHAGIGDVVPGGSGVTIFFSVSGFIITLLVLRERQKTGQFSLLGFYKRRAVKIFPPFLIIVIVPTIIYSVTSFVDVRAVAAQALFVFNWAELSGISSVLPGSGVVWSLAIEEQFYIAFALIWMVLVKARWWQGALVILSSAAIVLSTSSRIFLAHSGEQYSDRIYFGTDTRLDGIAWGVLAACVYHGWAQRAGATNMVMRAVGSDWTLIVAMLLYGISLAIRDDWFRDTFRYSLQSVSACLIIVFGLVPGHGRMRRVVYRVSVSKPIALIGLASYSIYLAHLVIYSLLAPITDQLALPIRVFTLAAVGVLAGIALYTIVELPIQRHFKPRPTGAVSSVSEPHDSRLKQAQKDM